MKYEIINTNDGAMVRLLQEEKVNTRKPVTEKTKPITYYVCADGHVCFDREKAIAFNREYLS